MRGKNVFLSCILNRKLGSPPLAREKLYGTPTFLLLLGITPACAGKTKRTSPQITLSWDHPRLRGKNGSVASDRSEQGGSPPLAREKHCALYRHGARDGITPACAGKTARPCKIEKAGRDHPRLRGKNSHPNLANQNSRGSPPLAREKRKFVQLHSSFLGITPACAGKTL